MIIWLHIRQDITPQDEASFICFLLLAAVSLTEAVGLASYATFSEYHNPDREVSILKKVCSKFNILLLIMFMTCLIASICAFCSVRLVHNNLMVKIPMSIQTFCAATIELSYMQYSWIRSKKIVEHFHSETFVRAVSFTVKVAPLLYYGQVVLFVLAAATGISVMVPINRIWTAVSGVWTITFDIFLLSVFCKFSFRQESDIQVSLSLNGKSSSNSNQLPSNCVQSLEQNLAIMKKLKSFKTIARHGIWACCFFFSGVVIFALELLLRLDIWVNVFQAIVYLLLNFAGFCLLVMKVRLDMGRKNVVKVKQLTAEDCSTAVIAVDDCK
ncbi:hypothetical protein HDU79_005696 [Rhizoclosmatium sp. JEL0117]|nr:hypothetical protein HDU79_005696 [Rhizoclosmatium sp. JEL0117]